MQILIPNHSLLQGVSEQPLHLRKQGQVQGMLNMLPDAVRGLRRRNAAVLATKSLDRGAGEYLQPIKIAGIPLLIVHNMQSGVLALYTLHFQQLAQHDNPTYLRGDIEDFQYIVYNESLIVLNRSKVVTRSPASWDTEQSHNSFRLYTTDWTNAPAASINPDFKNAALFAVHSPRSFLYAKSNDVHLSWSATLVKDYITRTVVSGNILHLQLHQRVYTCNAQNGSGTESQDGFITGVYHERIATLDVPMQDGKNWLEQQPDAVQTARQQRVIQEYIQLLSSITYSTGTTKNQVQVTDPLNPQRTLEVHVEARPEAQTGATLKIPNTGLWEHARGKVWLTRGTITSATGILMALWNCWWNMQQGKLGGASRDGASGSILEDLNYTFTENSVLVGASKVLDNVICIPSLYTTLGKTYGVASGSAYAPTVPAIEDLPPDPIEWVMSGVGKINPEYYEFNPRTQQWLETTVYPQELLNMPKQYQLEISSGMLEALRRNNFKYYDSFTPNSGKLTDITQPTTMFAGDTKSNPDPEFVGSSINGIAVYQGRLVLMNSDGVFFSATNKPWQFYRESVKDTQDTDPISVYNPQAVGNWRWAMEFNQDLYVFSPDTQGLIRGRNGLTTKQASLLLNSSSPCNTDIEPHLQGTTLLFSATKGSLDIRQMLVGAVADTATTPSSITAHCPSLGKIKAMYGHDSSGLLICPTGDTKFVVQSSIKEGYDYLQNAWYLWEINGFILHFVVYLDTRIVLYGVFDDKWVGFVMAYPTEQTTAEDTVKDSAAQQFISTVTLAAPSIKSGDNLIVQAQMHLRWVQLYLSMQSASEFYTQVQHPTGDRLPILVTSEILRRSYQATAATQGVPVLVQGDALTTVKLRSVESGDMTIGYAAYNVRTKQTLRQL